MAASGNIAIRLVLAQPVQAQALKEDGPLSLSLLNIRGYGQPIALLTSQALCLSGLVLGQGTIARRSP
jgi:hypothetical protein